MGLLLPPKPDTLRLADLAKIFMQGSMEDLSNFLPPLAQKLGLTPEQLLALLALDGSGAYSRTEWAQAVRDGNAFLAGGSVGAGVAVAQMLIFNNSAGFGTPVRVIVHRIKVASIVAAGTVNLRKYTADPGGAVLGTQATNLVPQSLNLPNQITQGPAAIGVNLEASSAVALGAGGDCEAHVAANGVPVLYGRDGEGPIAELRQGEGIGVYVPIGSGLAGAIDFELRRDDGSQA
jgi:hypothetical protein